MDILLKVLEELHFSATDEFSIECKIDSKKTMVVNVKIMISKENASQVFLVIECDDSQLVDFVDGKIIKMIAARFRKNQYHRAEMDKNTTLLLMCKHSIDTMDLSSKVKIEDDPYYFKKYVFSYNDIGLHNAKSWLAKNAKNGSVIKLIQEYITNTELFAKYKDNHQNESIYTFFIELVTKLHCFPMKTSENKNIRTVKDYLTDEINALGNRPRKPINLDIDKIESFINSDIDFENADEVYLKWNTLFMIESEEN